MDEMNDMYYDDWGSNPDQGTMSSGSDYGTTDMFSSSSPMFSSESSSPTSDFNFSDYYGNTLNDFTSNSEWTQAPQFGSMSQLQMPQSSPNWFEGLSNRVQESLESRPDAWMGGLAKLWAASEEKKRNQQLGNRLKSLSERSVFDPFGSQRPQYQQELSRAVQDPYSSPIVANQVRAIQEAQNRKDAAAGRRSNQIGSAPAVLEAQAKVAQNYMNSLMTPAGANIAPNAGALGTLYSEAAKYGTMGNAPYASALGNIMQGQRASSDSEKILEALKAAIGK